MPMSIEGLSSDDILALPTGDLEALVLTGKPLVIRAGTAEVLAEFRVSPGTLSVDLAHIDGGGEGVLPSLVSLIRRYAVSRNLEQVEWLVRATNCARPNPKLRRVLIRRGFEVRVVDGRGECYYKIEALGVAPAQPFTPVEAPRLARR